MVVLLRGSAAGIHASAISLALAGVRSIITAMSHLRRLVVSVRFFLISSFLTFKHEMPWLAKSRRRTQTARTSALHARQVGDSNVSLVTNLLVGSRQGEGHVPSEI